MNESDNETTREHLDAELTLLSRRLRWMAVTLAREVENGLEVTAYGLLGVLYEADHDVRGSALAEKFGLDKSTVSRQIARMEALGLLERVTDPLDARARQIRITETGRSLVRRLRTERGRWLDSALHDWPDADVEQLAELLSRLNTSLKSPGRVSRPSVAEQAQQ